MNLQRNEFRKEFSEFAVATRNSFNDMFLNKSQGGERFAAWMTSAKVFHRKAKQLLPDICERVGSSTLEAVLGDAMTCTGFGGFPCCPFLTAEDNPDASGEDGTSGMPCMAGTSYLRLR